MSVNTGGRRVLFEYQVKTAPGLTCHTQAEKDTLRKLVRKNKETLEQTFDNYVFFEGFLYSFEKIEDSDLPQQLSGEVDDVEYLVSYEYSNELDFSHQSVQIFFRAYINTLIREAGFKQVRGGKHFSPHRPKQLQGVDMYQAFFNTMKAIDGNIYLNLNPSIKFFQQEPIGEAFHRLGDPRKVKKEFEGRSVMTYYNNRVYTITEIKFDMNPEDTFYHQHKAQTISYAEYLREQYKIKLQY